MAKSSWVTYLCIGISLVVVGMSQLIVMDSFKLSGSLFIFSGFFMLIEARMKFKNGKSKITSTID